MFAPLLLLLIWVCESAKFLRCSLKFGILRAAILFVLTCGGQNGCRRIPHQYRVTLLIGEGAKRSVSVKIFTFFNYSVPTVWLDRFAVTCSISFPSVSILFLFLFILTVLTEWDSFYSEFAEEENHSREMGYVTITITIVFGVTFLLLIFKVCHTTLLHWNNQFDRRLCVRFRLQLFAILCLIWFWFLNITIHFTQAVQFFLLICLSIKSYKNYTWRRGGLFSFLLDAFSLVLVFV